MAEECGGLPLALKVIGAAMFGKTSDEHEWKPLLKKLNESRMQERTMKNELYEHLKLGYDVLNKDDPRLQDCFTYFAAFPEDYEVEFEVLLWCWIGEGLIPGCVGDDPEFEAYDLLMKLRRRSLIESIEKLNANLEYDWDSLEMEWHMNMKRAMLYQKWNDELDEGFQEILDEDLDEQSNEEQDEQSDEELDWVSDEDLHEELDEEVEEGLDEGLDEESDEESDEKFDEEVFPGYKVHDVMRDLAFYILQIDGGTTPAKQLSLYQAGQNLTEFPPKWITECKQPLKAHRLSLHQNLL
jgi:hypothetical protein